MRLATKERTGSGAADEVVDAPESRGDGHGRTRDAHARLVKVSFNLPEDELEALKELADRRQTTATQVVRESLMTERYIQQLVDNGATILAKLNSRGVRAREIVFSHMQFGAGASST